MLKKNNIFRLLLLILVFQSSIYSQVGINTTTPTKTLDVNGELRVRTLPSSSSVTQALYADNDGNVVTSNKYVLTESEAAIASNPVDQYLTGGGTIVNNINLGLSLSVFVPANKTCMVQINYSVPVGIASFSNSTGYYGIRFLKDGVEYQPGSRKYSMIQNGAANMVTVSNVVSETLTPVAFDRTIVYTLNGYIEKNDGGTHTYRFNMWDGNPVNNNFNWGKATMIKLVFLK